MRCTAVTARGTQCSNIARFGDQCSKHFAQKHTKVLGLRLEEEEYSLLERCALEGNHTISGYAKAKILEGMK